VIEQLPDAHGLLAACMGVGGCCGDTVAAFIGGQETLGFINFR